MNIWRAEIVDSYFGSAVHVRAEPDGFVCTGAGFHPPGFAGNDIRIGGNARLVSFHVAENLDGIFGASLIWIQPVLTCVAKEKVEVANVFQKMKCKNRRNDKPLFFSG